MTKSNTLVLGVRKTQLMQAFMQLSQKAWERVIRPKIKNIRLHDVRQHYFKGSGTDFFTAADVEAENIIKRGLIDKFGKDAFRVYGEEQGKYSNNINSEITIRIDPIDGTEEFKFGKPNWSIMIGVYTGRGKQERQIVATVFYPEYYNQMVCRVGDEVFIKNFTTKKITLVTKVQRQNDLSNIIVGYFKHSELNHRGRIGEIIKQLEKKNVRVRSLSSTEPLEAILTGGRRAMVIDGDFDQSDFISYSILAQLGYKVYQWNGQERNVDDPDLTDTKLVVVPPGKAGEELVKIVMRHK
jgi:fructose-1,6-bisphosphatase/inositol monophosphatase family enzyme